MLGNIDRVILYFFNRDLANPVFDILFVTISESVFMFSLIAILILIVAIKDGAKGRLVAILAIVCFAITDPSAHYILKKLFCRLRPCYSLDDLRLIIGCGGLYGFPSNHAANSFALAFIFSFFYRRLTAIFFLVATIVCLSRVYLGKHYLSDVVGGAIFGVLVAVFVLYFGRKPVQQLLKIRSFDSKGSMGGKIGNA